MAKTNQENLVNVLDNIDNGQFFTVVFKKKDKSIRTMNARKGVTKYLRGGDNKMPRNIRTVWDRPNMAYRSLDVNRLIEVRHGGKVYKNDGTVHQAA